MLIFLIALAVAFGCFYLFNQEETEGGIPVGVIAFFVVMFFIALFFD